jgi:hypothetical protein
VYACISRCIASTIFMGYSFLIPQKHMTIVKTASIMLGIAPYLS